MHQQPPRPAPDKIISCIPLTIDLENCSRPSFTKRVVPPWCYSEGAMCSRVPVGGL